jgi:hypothetical protein
MAGLFLMATACASPRTAPDGYLVRRSVDASSVGAPGDRLDLLEDERITDTLRSALAQWSDGSPCADSTVGLPASFCAAVATVPLRRAVLRAVSSTGIELSRLPLETAIAEIKFVAVPRTHDSLLTVEVDLSAGFGSYSGPLARLPELDASHLRWARAVAQPTGDTSEVDLVTTLKTGWEIDSLADHLTLLLVACRPDFEKPTKPSGEDNFVISYTRLSRDGAVWHATERHESGFWENEGDFPSRERFR